MGLGTSATNANVPSSVIERVAKPEEHALALLQEATKAMQLSARGFHRVLRVARTIADLDGCKQIGRVHLAEALGYRMRLSAQEGLLTS